MVSVDRDMKDQVRTLNRFILAHPEAKFILSHGGFPWYGTNASLAKNIPNVYIDMVWFPQIGKFFPKISAESKMSTVPGSSPFP